MVASVVRGLVRAGRRGYHRRRAHARPRQPIHPVPLAGIVVVDCSTVLAGPYCTMLLADLGADVVKVEPPDGDGTRAWGPPWVGAGRLAPDDPGVAAYYLAVNRNKRSIRLDLKTEPGRAILRRLLARADVLVENFRVGGFAGLGFGDDVLATLNPRLVHLAISGYGPTGPDAAKPGYDFVIQAAAGLMSITGAAGRSRRRADEGRRRDRRYRHRAPRGRRGARRARPAGIVLVRRARAAGSGSTSRSSNRPWRSSSTRPRTRSPPASRRRGAGTPIRTSSRTRPSPRPTARSRSPSARSASGRGSARRSGSRSLATDPRFASNAGRVANREALRSLLAARLSVESSSTWLDRLEAAEVPCAPINDVLAALTSPQAMAREHGRRRRPSAPRSDPPGRPSGQARSRLRPRSGPRRRCSASRPTKSSPSSATTGTKSPSLRAAGVV